MRILDFEEAQGLTGELVRAWFERMSWKPRQAPGLRNSRTWENVHGREVFDYGFDPKWLENLLGDLCFIEKCRPQVLLREINPRWTSWPSDAAIAAHDGKWLAQRKDDGACTVGFMELRGGEFCLVFEIGRAFIRKQDNEHWRVWPCDRDGARVRRPTDEHGAMR